MTNDTHTEDVASEQVDWERLSPLTMAATGSILTAIAIGSAIICTIFSVPAVFVWPFVPVPPLVVVGIDYLRWRRTDYRLTDERLELRKGIVVRSYKAIPRDRIRSVDSSAHAVYRIFGITIVKVGTGQNAGGRSDDELTLDPVDAAAADVLRTELLRRGETPATGTTSATVTAAATAEQVDARADEAGDTGAPDATNDLARLDPSWIRYAPFGILTPLLAAGAVGALFEVAGWFNKLPWQFGATRSLVEPFKDALLPIGVVLLAIVFLLVGAIGATAIWIETWWNYRLEREAGVLRVRRGLLTSRSISLEEARLRGVELVEPLSLRRARVGHTNAVATGMASASDRKKGADKKALLPAAPLDIVDQVSARVLREADAPRSGAVLTTHPAAARRRRLVWGLSAVTVTVLALVILGLLFVDALLWLAIGVAVVGYVAATLLALDAYRNLGHGLTERYLVLRRGTVLRRTVALQRSGVIGLRVRRSPFQRRSGIATVTATTAAGNGKYAARDVELGEGLEYADAAVPGLLSPFLIRDDPPALVVSGSED